MSWSLSLSSALGVGTLELLRSQFEGILATVVTVCAKNGEDLHSIPHDGALECG